MGARSGGPRGRGGEAPNIVWGCYKCIYVSDVPDVYEKHEESK